MTVICNIEENKKKCTCTYMSCDKRGKCCECIAYHRKRGELPGCLFPPDKEKTYDRSIEFFIKCFS
ncbi:MAG: DUF6485 family protein [Candidatus Helarchaeota archaeon]